MQVRCCCDASLKGYAPLGAPLKLRELEGGGVAFDGESKTREELARDVVGFVPATDEQVKKDDDLGRRRWR